MFLGKIGGGKIKGVEIVKAIKQKAVELLVGIILKEDFKVIFYDKLKAKTYLKINYFLV